MPLYRSNYLYIPLLRLLNDYGIWTHKGHFKICAEIAVAKFANSDLAKIIVLPY